MNDSKYASLHGAPPPQGPRSMQPGRPQAAPAHLRQAVPVQAHQAPQAFANAPPPWGGQDARSNLAVQPAADGGTMKLKKKAVKIVGAAAPLPVAAKPVPVSSPAPGPVMAKPKATEGYASATPAASTPSTKTAAIKIETPSQSKKADDSLDDMFTRLTNLSVKSTPQAGAATSPARPDKGMFSFEDRLSEVGVGKKVLGDLVAASPAQAVQPKREEPAIAVASNASTMATQQKYSSRAEIKEVQGDQESALQANVEAEYMRKAREYVNALPGGKGTSAHTIQFVTNKLRSSYAPTAQTSREETEILKARYVFAVVQYVKALKKGVEDLTAASVKQILNENDGDFLQLCATLVGNGQISLDNLDEVIGLCKTVLDILPKPEPDVVAPVKTGSQPKSLSQDPVDSMSAWPSQEKRDNPAGYRTCILKGIAGVKSINQLQALVWGGKIEYISPPDGTGFGIVRFLTVEGCQKYYEATQNGIEIPSSSDKDKKTIVLVERTEGPNSVNDNMRACAEGDASRCVRAVGAGDESDASLMRLARGKDKLKREIDTIKRGKTSRGHNYVEFRFANIYHALNFRREIMTDEDWEHYTIGYAADPCEKADGVHFKDAE